MFSDMKILVLSDTHGAFDRVNSILNIHAYFDALLFLGDGLRDIPEYCRGASFAVRGNCDMFCDCVPTEQSLTFDGMNIFMTHGHTYSVKYGEQQLILAAALKDSDIVLFGHTHIPVERYLPEGYVVGDSTLTRPMYMFNPGRVRQGSYGLVQIKNGSVLLSHGCV